MDTNGDRWKLTATDAVRLIRAGKLRPIDLTEACLARIAEREPKVRAFAWFDADYARTSAATACPGPLHGLPLGIKDVLDTADMPSEYGSPIWHGWRPKADAAAVAWARAAGAVFYGKTVTTEFATRKPGPTANPANLAHTPGGSSSGSAAGVAAGFFPFAYGTQTAGSVIRPAAFCGVVGYKPSFGLISRFGMKVMSDSLDTVGVIARSVADCALLAGAVSGRGPGRSGRTGGSCASGGCVPLADLGSGGAGDGASDGPRCGGAGAGRRGGVGARIAGGVRRSGAGPSGGDER
jgi:Asp-tRNA(Asn)/Glu-tRNA(Gln) amidotransferase A subunit family amidase